MSERDEGGISVLVSDVSRQKHARAERLQPEAPVAELVERFIDQLRLPRTDASGYAIRYHALLEREARHVHASERIGEALQPGDQLYLHPAVDAG